MFAEVMTVCVCESSSHNPNLIDQLTKQHVRFAPLFICLQLVPPKQARICPTLSEINNQSQQLLLL